MQIYTHNFSSYEFKNWNTVCPEQMTASLIGITYLILGVSGITLTSVVIFVKCKLFKKVYNNATYLFMVTLGFSDIASSLAVSIYAGLILLLPRTFDSNIGQRVFCFLLLSGWHTGDIFLCLVAYSRYIALAKAESVHLVFSKRKRWVCIVTPWILCSLVYSPSLYYPTYIGKFFPDKVSWDYDTIESSLSEYLSYVNIFANCTTIVIQFYYNIKSIIWLRSIQQTLLTQDQRRSRQREKKLFVQCFINSCLYTFIVIMFITLNHRFWWDGERRSIWLYFLLNVVWIFHHSSNAIVYLILNRRLRSDIRATFCCSAENTVGDITTGRMQTTGT